MAADSPWVSFVRVKGGLFQKIKLASRPEPEHEAVETRPTYGSKMVKVKVLLDEVGPWFHFERGHVVLMPNELAAPRIRDGRGRPAEPSERLTSEEP